MSGGGGSTTTKNNIPDQLVPLANAYVPKAIAIGDTQFQPYTGQRFAGMNPSQQAAGDFYLKGIGQGTNPWLDQMVTKAQTNLVDNYNNVLRPQQDALAARSGSFGNSGVQQTVNQQQKQLLGGLGDISTSLYGGQYQNDQANRFQAAQGLLGYGGLQQANAQQPLDFAFQQFQEAQNQPYKNLTAMSAPFSQNLGGTSSTQQNPSALQNGLGLALLGSAIFSDERLKEDIKRVGETNDGLPVYTYKYKGDKVTQMGVMAQDVKKKRPEAVKEVDGGLLMVDYSLLSRNGKGHGTA